MKRSSALVLAGLSWILGFFAGVVPSPVGPVLLVLGVLVMFVMVNMGVWLPDES